MRHPQKAGMARVRIGRVRRPRDEFHEGRRRRMDGPMQSGEHRPERRVVLAYTQTIAPQADGRRYVYPLAHSRDASTEVGQITAFATVLLVSFLLLTMAGLYTFRYAKMPASLDFIDRIVGTLLGLVMGALFLGIFAVVLRQLFIDRNPAASVTLPFMQTFQAGVRSSFLVSFFGSNILPLIYGSLRPVLPQSSDIIFRVH